MALKHYCVNAVMECWSLLTPPEDGTWHATYLIETIGHSSMMVYYKLLSQNITYSVLTCLQFMDIVNESRNVFFK